MKITNTGMNSVKIKPIPEHRKSVLWIGSSLKDLKELPEDVQKDLGHSLRDVQRGRDPGNVKLLRHLGSGVWQVSTDDRAGTFRLIYLLELADCVAVLHVFQKKSKTGVETPKKEIELIQERIRFAQVAYREWRARK